jgi:hypothetical protein
MPVDLERYMTDANYRRQLAQEEIRSRRAKKKPGAEPNPGLERARQILDDEDARRAEMKRRQLQSRGYDR